MALGGGKFVTQNKILPGSYLNFVSATKVNISLEDGNRVSNINSDTDEIIYISAINDMPINELNQTELSLFAPFNT